jgi:hypothetical protein
VNRLERALEQAATDLTRHGRAWALVGGFAVSARALPRFTRDIDLVVAVDDDGIAERLVRDLLGDGYLLFSTVEHDSGRLAEAAVKLITARGYDRGRDLVTLLNALASEESR